MSLISRRNFLYLLSLITFILAKKSSYAQTPLPSWDSIHKLKMKGQLKVFWNVVGADRLISKQKAIQHGFRIATGINTYADYPGKQKENIDSYIKENHCNPWEKPSFFEKIIKQNIKNLTPSEFGSIFYHDIETSFNDDIQSLWQDSELKKLSQAKNLADFTEKYYQQVASWYSLPCQWYKQMYPSQPVGIYGPQVFNRDYWGFTKPSELEQKHSADLKLWKYIDPYVDYYVSSAYIFYDLPDSIYYVAANVEENYLRSRKFSNKPLYVFLWLRFHSKEQQELSAYLTEAIAVIPFFTGAKGIVLWGWEPKSTGQYYHNLPIFMNSLGRVADWSAKIDNAQLIIDKPAYQLWQNKEPLIRKLKITENEWLIMAVYPWQQDSDQKMVMVNCGKRTVEIEITGKRTVIYHIHENALEKIST